MGRKKKVEVRVAHPEQPMLSEQKAEARIQKPESDEAKPTGPLREYLFVGEMMRVGRFDLLEVEFSGIVDGDLPKFHEVISIHTRGWMIVRRLFGICPVIPKRGTPEEDLRTWSREELTAALGITTANLKEEMDRLRGLWGGTKQEKLVAAQQHRPTGDEHSADELFEAERLVAQYQMGDLLTREEVPWMASRLESSRTMLNHGQVGELMRMTLLTELDLRRIHTQMSRTSKQKIEETDPEKRSWLNTEYERIFKTRSELMKVYQEQLERIDKIFPFMKQASGSMTMRGVFSDAVACHTEWYKNGDNQLADGIFSAAEIEILMRTSVQAPEPQYRAGQVVYLNQAKAHLFDPTWRGEFAPRTLRRLDAGFTAAAVEISKSDGETLVDLLSDDPVKGEYQEAKKSGDRSQKAE